MNEKVEAEVLDQIDNALNKIGEWVKSKPALILEKNTCSRLHHLQQAYKEGRLVKNPAPTNNVQSILWLQHTFVVKHDWAGAFHEAEGITDDFNLPFDFCCFEFRIGGHTVIAVVHDSYKATPGFFWLVDDLWFCLTFSVNSEVHDFLTSQIRAICIALDAEVAVSSVVRAPHKLNQKRERKGQVPLSDYHVVDLARRHRVANPTAGHTGSKKRLHFRRGHWRHFEESKTWVKWCLVGDFDLGFIDKHYQL